MRAHYSSVWEHTNPQYDRIHKIVSSNKLQNWLGTKSIRSQEYVMALVNYAIQLGLLSSSLDGLKWWETVRHVQQVGLVVKDPVSFLCKSNQLEAKHQWSISFRWTISWKKLDAVDRIQWFEGIRTSNQL